jgi:hypothetical protein
MAAPVKARVPSRKGRKRGRSAGRGLGVAPRDAKDALELEVEMWPGSYGSDFVVTEGKVVVETVSRESHGEGFVKRVRLVPLTDRVVVQHYATFEPGPRSFGTWREVRTWYVYERGKGWRVEKTEEHTGWDELERAFEEPEPEER